MSLQSRLVRSSLGASTGLVLAGVGLVALPGTAHAVAVTNTSHQAIRQVSENGPATCTVGSPSVNDVSTFVSNGTTFTRTASGTSVITDSGDPSDTGTVNQSVVSKVRATEAGGQLASLHLDASITTSISSAQSLGTDCDPQALGAAVAAFETVLTTGRWVSFDGFLPGSGVAVMSWVRTSPTTPSVSEQLVLQGTQKGRLHAEVFLPAGTYGGNVTITNVFNSPQTASDPTSQTVTPSIDVVLSAPGTAVAKAAGDGGAYAKLKNGVDCAKGQLKGSFTKAAGTKDKPAIKKAIFKVNGAKSKVIKGKKTAKGKKFTLKGLPADLNVEVQATFKLVGGGKATLSREYFSCS